MVADYRRDALDVALLAAARPNIRPVFHRGKQVGEYEMRDRALSLYLLKRADIEAERAELRRSFRDVERPNRGMSGLRGHSAP